MCKHRGQTVLQGQLVDGEGFEKYAMVAANRRRLQGEREDVIITMRKILLGINDSTYRDYSGRGTLLLVQPHSAEKQDTCNDEAADEGPLEPMST